MRILLIEDSQILTVLLKHEAKTLKTNLVCVDSFVDAINELKNNFFNVIILDNHLEKENLCGTDIAKTLKEHSSAKIILSSADNCIVSNKWIDEIIPKVHLKLIDIIKIKGE